MVASPVLPTADPTGAPHAPGTDGWPTGAAAVARFIAASPSPYHAVATAAERLLAAGFGELDLAAAWDDTSGDRFVRRGGALIAWRAARADTGGGRAVRGMTLVAAHTDSPNLRIKPRPDTGAVGWRQLAVEVYGGPLLNSWLDRDLGLSGRVVTADGSVHLVRIDRPLLRVPQLAIHLDREVNERGVQLDKQLHLTPIWGLGPVRDGELVELLGAELGVAPATVVSWDLMVHDLTPPALLGRDRELIAAARLDNQCSCALGLEDLLAGRASDAGHARVLVLFDHEEVGSESSTGAAGALLPSTLDRLLAGLGVRAEDRPAVYAASLCVSSDMAHAVHPNYPERHEPGHRPLPNNGAVIKVNSNQRYATDAVSAAAFAAACTRAGVPWQVFVSRNSMPCGSTIGPITSARLGLATVDVGLAQLSMHSARELAGALDPDLFLAALREVQPLG